MKEKKLFIFISLVIVFSIAAILYFQPPFFNHWIIKLEDDNYDRQVRRFHKPLSPHPSIAIINIDDASIAQEGRWPWDRLKMAQLTSELGRLGAAVIAFDMVFSEAQTNPIDQVLKVVENPQLASELKQLKGNLDSDTAFAQELKKGTAILGFAFSSDGKEIGQLPPPLLILSEQEADKSLIPQMNGYIGNLPQFQGDGGFINTTIDADGILRFSPLLMRNNEKVYPSLALEAAKRFLSLPFSGILTAQSRGHSTIQSLQLGTLNIHTDPWGRILIPYRGPPHSFPSISATDVLHGKVKEEDVRGKLLFIGTSATGSSDFLATAISPVFPGVEVQASIASGIIDNYLPHKPNWGRGTAVLIVLVLGIIAAFTFPFMGQTAAFLFSIAIIILFEGINYWIWKKHGIILSFFFPVPTLVTIFVLDLITIYLSDKKHKQEMKRIFGYYVPPETLDQIVSKKGEVILSGEEKTLSFLFAQIWDFSTLTERLTAVEMKQFLNIYFTEMNQIIFEHQGTLDKFVRDQIMAFWGAPLPHSEHAAMAVKTAIAMQKRLSELSLPIPIKIGIGINTGTVHVGDMGSKFHRTYTAIGKPVDLAHHLANLTQTYSVDIIVGAETQEQTKEIFSYKKLDEGIYTIK